MFRLDLSGKRTPDCDFCLVSEAARLLSRTGAAGTGPARTGRLPGVRPHRSLLSARAGRRGVGGESSAREGAADQPCRASRPACVRHRIPAGRLPAQRREAPGREDPRSGRGHPRGQPVPSLPGCGVHRPPPPSRAANTTGDSSAFRPRRNSALPWFRDEKRFSAEAGFAFVTAN